MDRFLRDLFGYVDFGEEDARRLAEFLPAARPHFRRIAEHFYAKILEHPSAHAAIRGGPEQVERLKGTLVDWMESGLSGPHDDAWLARRRRIGRVHVRIELPQEYMFSAMNVVRRDFKAVVAETGPRAPAEARRLEEALDKLFDLELAIMLDTYREASEEALLKKERLAAIGEVIETVQALFLVLDAAGRILEVNEGVCAATGLERSSLLGAPWVERCVAPGDAEKMRSLFERVMASDGPVAETFRLRHTDGGERWVSWRFSQVEAHGERRFVASGLDITGIRELEQRARLSERLAAVGTLSAGLAHEIRNPLNAASLQLELLQRRLAKLSPDERIRTPLAMVREEILRLSRLVQDFLLFARPKDLEVESLDLAQVAHSVVELMAPVAVERGATLTVEATGPVQIEADREKLQQVLLNLVGNALDAVDEGGHVSIGVEAARQGARIAVRDDGCGISPEDLPRIFEPFYSAKPGGTGLGMAIVHAVVTVHGGTIDVESSGEGTVMRLFLPKTPPKPAHEGPRA